MDLAARPLRVDRLDLIDQPTPTTRCSRWSAARVDTSAPSRAIWGGRWVVLGHVQWLRREWSGPFRAQDGWAPDEITRRAGTPALSECLRPLEDALSAVPCVQIDATQAARFGWCGGACGRADGTVWASLEGRAVAWAPSLPGCCNRPRVFAA